ncbi:MAG: hypothetical protein P1P87_13280 [Trueperaceae bacterium]|nr:hypothetical protein [Trueperaceae bacterium]
MPDTLPLPAARGVPAAVAGLQGLPLLEAVFPGRVLKVEQPEPVADPGSEPTDADDAPPFGDATLDAPPIDDVGAPDDEAIPLLTPLRRDP